MQTTQSIGRYLLLLGDERCAFGVAGTTSLVAGGSAESRTLEWFDSVPEVGLGAVFPCILPHSMAIRPDFGIVLSQKRNHFKRSGRNALKF
jgi:hypothetical protein